MRVTLDGIGTIDTRKPVWGDSDELNMPHIVTPVDNNLPVRFSDLNWTTLLNYAFVIQIPLCSAFFQMYNEIVEWLEINNGLPVTYTKYINVDESQDTREGILKVVDAVEDKNFWNFSFILVSKL